MLLPLPLLLLACSQESSISGRIEQAPQVSIQAPLDGDVLSEDEAIEFVGLVTDGNGLGDLVVLSWESDRQGELATQDDARWDGEGLSRFATTLDPGTHAISLSVVDSTERTAQASISITVEEVNTAPTAEITSPGAFESFSLGSDITLVGGASDPNQPADELIATWTWEPELGGSATEIATVSPTATGTVLSTWEQPPVGSYRLRLLITDAEGQEADAEGVINVEDPNAGDADQDGWTLAQGDCDDNDPDVNPAAAELCNSIDDDCNGDIDDKDDDGDDHVDIDCVDHEGPLPADELRRRRPHHLHGRSRAGRRRRQRLQRPDRRRPVELRQRWRLRLHRLHLHRKCRSEVHAVPDHRRLRRQRPRPQPLRRRRRRLEHLRRRLRRPRRGPEPRRRRRRHRHHLRHRLRRQLLAAQRPRRRRRLLQ